MLGLSPVVAFVPTLDLARARRFYGTTLGLRLQGVTDGACVFRAGATELRVTRVDRLRPQPFTVLGWVVADIARTVDELADAEVRCTRFEQADQDERAIWTSPDGARVAWFTDPDGNILSLTQLPDS